MNLETVVFYLVGGFTLFSALCVILFANPIYSALFLALTMTGAAALFFSLGAYFVAGVQLIVYAGAVMVMFVMVVMLIDLKQEKNPFSRGLFMTFLKVFSSVLVGGILISVTAISIVGEKTKISPAAINAPAMETTKEMAMQLFTKYLFGFEAIGVVLLVVLVGSIALARARGGTHA